MREGVNPAGADAARLTTPVNPLTDVTVMTEVPDAPSATVMETGLAVNVKPDTTTVRVIVWVNDPLVPVTSTK